MTPPSDNSSSPGPLVSTKRELRNLGANSQATAAELKAFLAELKGRSPQEMLGIVAASQLFRSLVLSSIAVLVLILVFTIIPYLMGDQGTGKMRNSDIAQPGPTQMAQPAPTDTNPERGETMDNTLQGENQPDLSPLGVNEEKTAPPNENPLDSDNDNFLDGLDR